MSNEILQGNVKIAEFMGVEPLANWTAFLIPKELTFMRGQHIYSVNEFQFHSSWDWLMPVVGKINTLAIDNIGEVEVVIFSNMVSIAENLDTDPIIQKVANDPKELILTVWEAVVVFIDWYTLNVTPS